jgi:allantoinase
MSPADNAESARTQTRVRDTRGDATPRCATRQSGFDEDFETMDSVPSLRSRGGRFKDTSKMQASTGGWPGGRRTAVVISVLFETWSEKKSPSYFARTTPLKAGQIDRGGIQWAEYGGKEGAWRLIRVLDQCRMRGSFFCSGRSAELYPDVFKQIAKSGHAVEGHGYVQDQAFLELTPDQQRDTIRKVVDILAAASGRPPEGWATPIYGWDEHTFALLVEAGIKWYADALDISLPRKENTAAGPIVALPWSDFVDNRVLRASPRDYLDVYIDTFDYLHKYEPGGLINIAIHSHFGGRPLIVAQFQKLLRYFASFSDVWFPTHRELVDWFLRQNVDNLSYQKRFFPPG